MPTLYLTENRFDEITSKTDEAATLTHRLKELEQAIVVTEATIQRTKDEIVELLLDGKSIAQVAPVSALLVVNTRFGRQALHLHEEGRGLGHPDAEKIGAGFRELDIFPVHDFQPCDGFTIENKAIDWIGPGDIKPADADDPNDPRTTAKRMTP